MRTRAEIVERARVHVGHHEMPIGSNDSPLIRAWLRRCGVTSPAAWCAAFASWCVEDQPANGGPVQVACAGALRLGRAFPATRNPQPGDLMFFATDDQGHGHVGIVIALLGLDEVLCVEGNSENRVRIVRRLRSEVLFARTRGEDWSGPMLDLGPPERWPLVRVSKSGTR